MKPVKCPNCGNEIAVDENNQYLSCGSCGKRYVNPYYVKKESSNATAEQSNQVEQNEKPKGSWRCVSCKAILPSDDSSPTLTCPACGRNHKNPSYKPPQPAVVQENVVQNINNTVNVVNNEQTVIVQQSVINAPSKVGESKFTGTYGSLLGNRIVNSLISIFTLGFGIPWVICRSHRWVVDHTVIDGRRLKFDGTAGNLFGSWIKWMFLTLITCGIYGLWVPLKRRAWIVEHSHIEGLAGESKFTGGLASFLGLQIVNALIMIFTLGLGLPWVVCRTEKWDSEHQIIDGQRIYFDGNAAQLFGNWIKWILLTIITFGIYSVVIPIRKQAWIVKHQSFVKPMGDSVYQTSPKNPFLIKYLPGLCISSVFLILSLSFIAFGVVVLSISHTMSQLTLVLFIISAIMFVASAIMLDYFNRKKKAIETEIASQQNFNIVNIANNIPSKRTITCPKCGGAVVCDEDMEFVVCSGCQTRYKNPYYKR